MKKLPLFFACTLASVLLTPIIATAQIIEADVVYREIFPREAPAAGPVSMADYGWFAHRGPTATQVTNFAATASDGGRQWAVSAGTGRPTNATAVNSNPPTTDTSLGFAFFYANEASTPTLMWTDEYSHDLQSIQRFDWWQGNANSNDVFRLAIRVGTDWYVSNQDNQQTGNVGTFSTQAEQMTQLMAGSTWSTLNFIPGSTLSVGAATTLPLSGTVTAFGLYAPTQVQNTSLRFDTFTVSIPEPGSVVLLTGGLMVLTLLRRRRNPVRA